MAFIETILSGKGNSSGREILSESSEDEGSFIERGC